MISILINFSGETIVETTRNDPQNDFIQYLSEDMSIVKLADSIWRLEPISKSEDLLEEDIL